MATEKIRGFGGYRNLLCYRKAEWIYDATFWFCRNHLEKHDRTAGQMIQAARSCKQNIAEGSMIAARDRKLEAKLTAVALASIEELMIDYEDFLRVRHLECWGSDVPKMASFRAHSTADGVVYESIKDQLESLDPTQSANCILSLVKTTRYLLSRLLESMEENCGMR